MIDAAKSHSRPFSVRIASDVITNGDFWDGWGLRQEFLQEIVRIAFWVSLEQEEGQSLPLSLAIGTIDALDVLATGGSLLQFEERLPLTNSALCKLALSADPERSCIVVCPGEDAPLCDSPPQICGLVRRNEIAGGLAWLVLDAPRPGELIFTAQRSRVLAFKADEIELAGLQLLGPHLGGLVVTFLDQHWSFFTVLRWTLSAMRRGGRGGALLVLPDDSLANLTAGHRLAPPGELPKKALHLFRETVASYESSRGLDPITNDSEFFHALSGAPHQKDEIRRLHERCLENYRQLESAAELLADLSRIDGAVVVNRRLEVLAFGTKIEKSTPSDLSAVYEALDLTANQPVPMTTTSGMGTRHTSAMALCQERPGTLALVVSQDRGVSCVLSEREGRTLLWRDVEPDLLDSDLLTWPP